MSTLKNLYLYTVKIHRTRSGFIYLTSNPRGEVFLSQSETNLAQWQPVAFIGASIPTIHDGAGLSNEEGHNILGKTAVIYSKGHNGALTRMANGIVLKGRTGTYAMHNWDLIDDELNGVILRNTGQGYLVNEQPGYLRGDPQTGSLSIVSNIEEATSWYFKEIGLSR